MVRHAINRPDHRELFESAQATQDRKRQLAALKRELADEKTSSKKTRNDGGNSAASSKDDPGAPVDAADAAGVPTHMAAGNNQEPQPPLAVDDHIVRFRMRMFPGFEFVLKNFIVYPHWLTYRIRCNLYLGPCTYR